MHIRILLEYFEKYKSPGNAFFFSFCQSSRYVSNEQSCLKKLDYMINFYSYLVCFSSLFFYILFSAPISFSLCSQTSPYLCCCCCCCSFSSHQVWQKSQQKNVYIYIQYIYNIYTYIVYVYIQNAYIYKYICIHKLCMYMF